MTTVGVVGVSRSRRCKLWARGRDLARRLSELWSGADRGGALARPGARLSGVISQMGIAWLAQRTD